MCKTTHGDVYNSSPECYTCKLCGQEENILQYNSSCKYLSIMAKQHVCFQCAFWIDKIANPPPNRMIIGGCHYTVHPFVRRPNNVLKGCGGKEFYIRKMDGTLIKSNNVWFQGEIPEHFRDQLPDMGHFLSLMTFQKLHNDTHTCSAKGCWDRYHCLRYDLSCEKDGPFNVIPTKHVIGSENCPSFINLSELKNL